MRSWVFRNRRRLEAIYGKSGRLLPEGPPAPASLDREPTGQRNGLRIVALIPAPRRDLRRAG